MLTSTPVPQCLAQTIVPLLSRQMRLSKQSDELNTLQHGDLRTSAESEDMLYSVTLDSSANLDLFIKNVLRKLCTAPLFVCLLSSTRSILDRFIGFKVTQIFYVLYIYVCVCVCVCVWVGGGCVCECMGGWVFF